MLHEQRIDAFASAWLAAYGWARGGDGDLACALDCRYSYVTSIDENGVKNGRDRDAFEQVSDFHS
jgi:hypothetical protein